MHQSSFFLSWAAEVNLNSGTQTFLPRAFFFLAMLRKIQLILHIPILLSAHVPNGPPFVRSHLHEDLMMAGID